MNPLLRNRSPIVLLGVLSIVGCGPTSPSTPDDLGLGRPSTSFAARTEGSTAALLAHLRLLEETYRKADPSDVDTSRANLLAYTRAAEATGKALMARKDAPEEARGKGAIAVIKALRDRTELDPKAFEALLATCDRIEAENPKSRLATVAAISRYEQIEDAPDEIVGTKERRFDRVLDAVKKLAMCDPVYPKTPELMRDVIEKARQMGRFDQVQELNRLYAKQFPDDRYSVFSPGAAELASRLGKPMDDLSGTDILTGRPLDLKALRGKVVLVDFWASWCGPCMQEMPGLLQLHARLAPIGFELIGFNLDESPETPRAVAQAYGVRWPQFFEKNVKDDGLTSPTVLRFGVAQIPLKLLIDQEGKLVAMGHSLEDIGPAMIPLLNRLMEAKKAADAAKPKDAGPAAPKENAASGASEKKDPK